MSVPFDPPLNGDPDLARWVATKLEKGRAYRFYSGTTDHVRACSYCLFVLVNLPEEYHETHTCEICWKGQFREELRAVPPLKDRLRAWGWWRIWGDRRHLTMTDE